MGHLIFRWLIAFVLLAGSIWQATLLFDQWRNIPRRDFNAWRIEYATLNLDQGEHTELKLQLRVDTSFELKKIALPNLEIVLTDANDDVIALQSLKPSQWIPTIENSKETLLMRGASPGTEINSTIPLSIPENATGYRIHITYN